LAEVNLIFAYLGLDHVEEADHVASQLLTRVPQEQNSCLKFATALMQLGRFEDAAGLIELAIEIGPIEPLLLELLGRAQWSAGAFSKAEQSWQKWIEADESAVAGWTDPSTRYLGRVWTGWLGNMCHLEIYQKARALGFMPSHRAVIDVPIDRVANPCLLNYWKRYFEVLPQDSLSVFNGQRRDAPLHTLQIEGSGVNVHNFYPRLQRMWEDQDRPPLL
jgi:tetratricopeptide (TPR) repeat protein